MLRKLIMVIAVSASVCACHTETVHDVAWWKSHDTERKLLLEQCNDNPGQLSTNPNCVNANEALNEKILDNKNTTVPDLPNN